MKTFVLMVAKTFPATHPKAGQSTGFYQKILDMEKIHTIRKNYPLWKKRIHEVNAGNARLSVREWTGKPYNSKQRELFELHRNEVSIQKLEDEGLFFKIDDKYGDFNLLDISRNDGLNYQDFINWFPITRKRKKVTEALRFAETMAIIHFTSFNY